MTSEFLLQLERIITDRLAAADTNSSYVATLQAEGLDAILKKIGEESAEVIIAAKDIAAKDIAAIGLHQQSHHNKSVRDNLIHESADLVFHLLLLLAHQGVSIVEVIAELERRNQ